MTQSYNSTIFSTAVTAVFILLLSACSQLKNLDPRHKEPGSEPGNNPGTSDPLTPPDAHTVIIIGDGIDPDHPDYAERVTGSYTVSCDYQVFSRLPFDYGSEIRLKNSVSNWFRNDNTGCRLDEGITFKAVEPFDPALARQTDWNAGLTKTPANVNSVDLENVKKVLHPDGRWRTYNATAVAALIARDNPETSLVLVQLNPEFFSDFKLLPADKCPVQSEIDALAVALTDESVGRIYTETAPNTLESALYGLIDTHVATVVVPVFAQAESRGFVRRLISGGCPEVDMEPVLSGYNKLAYRRLKHRFDAGISGKRKPMIVVPAGNDSAAAASDSDLRHCNASEFFHIQVGASTRDEIIATFSPQGECIDFYAPGDLTLVKAPLGFTNAIAGTDVSAGIIARYITLNFTPGDSPEDWITALEKLADKNKILPLDFRPGFMELKTTGTASGILEALNDPKYMNAAQLPVDFKSLKPLPLVW